MISSLKHKETDSRFGSNRANTVGICWYLNSTTSLHVLWLVLVLTALSFLIGQSKAEKLLSQIKCLFLFDEIQLRSQENIDAQVRIWEISSLIHSFAFSWWSNLTLVVVFLLRSGKWFTDHAAWPEIEFERIADYVWQIRFNFIWGNCTK